MDKNVDDESHRVLKLLEDGTLSDCSFIIGAETDTQLFNAHKVVLSLASPVFQSMFFGGLRSEMDEPISIIDVTSESFKKLLQYIYLGKVKLSSFDDAYDLYMCANKYLLPKLTKLCSNGMRRMLKSSNVCLALEFAILYDDKPLQQMCKAFVQINTSDVLKDASFEIVKLSTILEIFEYEELAISSENELLFALHRWARKECERKGFEEISANLRKVVGSAPEKIRFLSMTPDEFNIGLYLPPLLSNEEITSIRMELCMVDSSVFPLPPKFSTRTNCRNPPISLIFYGTWTRDVIKQQMVSTSTFSLKSHSRWSLHSISNILCPGNQNVFEIRISELNGKNLAVANVRDSTGDGGQIPFVRKFNLHIDTHYTLKLYEQYDDMNEALDATHTCLIVSSIYNLLSL